MLDEFADLVLGSRCAGCERPGRLLCPACEAALGVSAYPAWPTPTPPGLATPWAAEEYAGTVRALVLGHKEEGQFAARRPLGRLLAQAVARSLPPGSPADAMTLLVPVPSRSAVVRRRGYDPTAAIVRVAVGRLRSLGSGARAAPLLVTRLPVADQSGLDAPARARNLAGSMWCPSQAVLRAARRNPRAFVVVCDDVLTTGATAREAQRALEAAGVPVHAVATVAATRKRWPER